MKSPEWIIHSQKDTFISYTFADYDECHRASHFCSIQLLFAVADFHLRWKHPANYLPFVHSFPPPLPASNAQSQMVPLYIGISVCLPPRVSCLPSRVGTVGNDGSTIRALFSTEFQSISPSTVVHFKWASACAWNCSICSGDGKKQDGTFPLEFVILKPIFKFPTTSKKKSTRCMVISSCLPLGWTLQGDRTHTHKTKSWGRDCTVSTGCRDSGSTGH